MRTAIRFQIGSTWLCVEDGNGCAPGHPDAVTVALRASRPDGRLGRRIAANHATRRDEILALGLRLLDLADRMTPETFGSSGQTAGDIGESPKSVNFGPGDRDLIEHLSPGRPIDFARHVYAGAERLRARMPILRAAQCVLEHCDDETAKGLHSILAAVDMHGCQPFRSGLALGAE
ncbi:hypothetical protein [Trinickia mobilis]|uniref:hypothetical protein n=1 Tax=Trinickia mobilis TaxID=2816356 RepID=UPI001A8F8D51|nr:hypothetical protein [Trinickia mobilis]